MGIERTRKSNSNIDEQTALRFSELIRDFRKGIGFENRTYRVHSFRQNPRSISFSITSDPHSVETSFSGTFNPEDDRVSMKPGTRTEFVRFLNGFHFISDIDDQVELEAEEFGEKLNEQTNT